jgi:hypothetical protein
VEWIRRRHWKNNRKKLALGLSLSRRVNMSSIAGNDASIAAVNRDDKARL